MLSWYLSVSLVAGLLLASSNGETLGESREPDSLAESLNKLGITNRSRKGRSAPSFQFTFDVGCQEGVRTEGLDHTTLYPHISDMLKYTTLTYTTRVLGLYYKGRANMTDDGEDCLDWPDYHHLVNHGVGEHNYCRSPGGSGGHFGVWCLTSFDPVAWGFCPVPTCTQPILGKPDDNTPLQPHASISWPPAEMPSSWTICSAFMLYDWPSPRVSELTVWSLVGFSPSDINYYQDPSPRDSGVKLLFSKAESFQRVYRYRYRYPDTLVYYLRISTAYEEFPGKWIRTCFSYQKTENNTTQLRLVVDGLLIGDENITEVEYTMPELLIVGHYEHISYEHILYDPKMFKGITTDVNMFSSALSMERMVDMTNGQGGENCWIEGDFVSWSNSSWNLVNNATMLQLDKRIHSSCRKESSVNIFVMVGVHRQEDCMRHCQKLGDGRSPPVTTPQQWLSMQSEIEAIALENLGHGTILPNMWLSVTEGDLGEGLARLSHWPDTEFIEGQGKLPLIAGEGVWRDYYTGKRAESLLGGQTAETETFRGELYNCMAAVTERIGVKAMPQEEFDCLQSQMSCTCEYKRDPVVTLRGLCPQLYKEQEVDSKFIPLQNRSNPFEFHWQGLHESTLKMDASDKKWRLSSSMSMVSAILVDDPLLSFGLGLHKWEVSGDTWCNKGKNYKTLLKLTGCHQSREFTCNDGQCIKMEERCNQVPDCRDESDEKECKVIVLKDGYNKNIPPIRKAQDGRAIPANVKISIILMKVVEIEETDHSIHLQFQISLDWNEPRATYQNLKNDPTLNALTLSDMASIWLPLVVYDNTDQKEVTRMGMDWEWITTVAVTREEEEPEKSGLDEILETEIFQGGRNKLTMNQTYTWEFQCKYELQRYPFDTQVFETQVQLKLILISTSGV